MTTPPQRRKARFKAALALAQMTMKQWADEQAVTVDHVAMVLRGVRESQRLTDAIDAFIADKLGKARAA